MDQRYCEQKSKRIIPIYEELRFIDSLRFMQSSLDKLVQSLPEDSFDILDNHFEYCDQNDVKLLHGKGFYPYSYMDTFRKFNQKKAKLIFEKFDCRNMGEYHDLYLTVDTLELACWFERLRAVCLDSYSLDCAQYLSAPHLAGDAFLKICQPDLELLTDRNHLDIAEELWRGDLSSVYTKRLSTPNNKNLERFDDTQKSTYGLTIDANNLYGGIMKDFCLPLNSFQTDTEVTIEQILQTPDDAEFGYIVCVDLDYPTQFTMLTTIFQWHPPENL